jgi:hypothetical protein
MKEVLSRLFNEMRNLNRPREVEVLLCLIQGADFMGLAPFQRVLNGKDPMSVIGFSAHEWLRRSSGSYEIENTMRREDFAVLAVDLQKDLSSALKLVPASKVQVEEESSKKSFSVSGDKELLRKLLESLNLDSEQIDDDVQQLNIKCMVLKLLNAKLKRDPDEFVPILYKSGFYE